MNFIANYIEERFNISRTSNSNVSPAKASENVIAKKLVLACRRENNEKVVYGSGKYTK